MSSSSTAVAKCSNQPEARPGAPARSNLFASPGRLTVVLCLLLAAAVLVAYKPVAHNQFLNYDDDGYIAANPQIRAGLTWATVKWAFATYDQGHWHPVTWLSHALDCELFGLNPAAHHFMNVLLHALNAVLLFLLLQSTTGFRWRSLMVAALFALHPINVESVAWAAERKNVLSMTFFLLALLAYGWYARRPRFGSYALVAALFALALGSKSQVITFPFLLLLWDYCPLCRLRAMPDPATGAPHRDLPQFSLAWLLVEKLPLLLLSAASAVVTIRAQKAIANVQTLSQSSLLLRLETVAISYVRYVGKAFWPAKLVILYPYPARLYPAWQAAGAVMLLLLATVLVLRARNRRYLAVGWLWFLGSMVPMIGLVQVGTQAIADRYAYIPFIGLFVMITWLAADLAKPEKITPRRLALPALACLLALGIVTYRQVGYWHDSESFWRRTLALTGDNYIAQVNLGTVLLGHGPSEEAAEHLRAAVAINPKGSIANLNLGAYEDERGNLPAAIERYQVAAQQAGDLAVRVSAYNSLGFAYRGMGRAAEAKQSFVEALQLSPDSARAMTGLALIAQNAGDLSEAIRLYASALKVQPSGVGCLLLAQALRLANRPDEANAISEQVARFSPNPAEAQKTADLFLSGK